MTISSSDQPVCQTVWSGSWKTRSYSRGFIDQLGISCQFWHFNKRKDIYDYYLFPWTINPPPEWGLHFKNLLIGSKFLLVRADPILALYKGKQEVTKNAPLCKKWQKNSSIVPINLLMQAGSTDVSNSDFHSNLTQVDCQWDPNWPLDPNWPFQRWGSFIGIPPVNQVWQVLCWNVMFMSYCPQLH